jgi:hypothetical protein
MVCERCERRLTKLAVPDPDRLERQKFEDARRGGGGAPLNGKIHASVLKSSMAIIGGGVGAEEEEQPKEEKKEVSVTRRIKKTIDKSKKVHSKQGHVPVSQKAGSSSSSSIATIETESSSVSRKCGICKSTIQQPHHYCHFCSYSKGICSMCGKKILNTTSYNQSTK